MSRLEREVTGHFALYNHHLKTVLNTQWGLTEQPAWRDNAFYLLAALGQFWSFCGLSVVSHKQMAKSSTSLNCFL